MVTILTEAGYGIGFGHFYRMSGICDRVIHEGFQARMILNADQDARKNLDRSYVQFKAWQDAGMLPRLIRTEDIVIIDSYRVDLETLKLVRRLSADLIVIDDNNRLPYEGMSVLNPNYYACYMEYPDNKGNTYYLGKDYTLVREPFNRPFSRTVREKVGDVLITMGGTDLKGITIEVINYLNTIRSKNMRLHVVTTAAYRNLDRIRQNLTAQDGYYENIDAEEMSRLMKQADIAVATAGGTSNELIRMQCPSALIRVADNQDNNVNLMKKAGVVEVFDLAHKDIIKQMMSMKKREEMVIKMRALASDRTAADLILDMIRNR